MKVNLRSVPIEKRAEAARQLIVAGEDPYEMFAAFIFGEHATTLTAERGGYCANGHPWNEENTYVREGTGWRVCRACNNAKRSNYVRNERTACSYCGDPCYPSRAGGPPRCVTCYRSHLREGIA